MTDHTSKIIGTADATHYLVEITELAGTTRQIETFNSLANAKQFLRDQHFESTHVEFQTAYDEMCGTPTHASVIEQIKL